MKPAHICVPVLRRYDYLELLLASLRTSAVKPAGIHIINNGGDSARLRSALTAKPAGVPVNIWRPEEPLGLAESWNWFIRNVPEERIISNDDITFYPETIGAFLATREQYPLPDLVFAQHGYSCFLIRDSCIEKVGEFDETISPGYAYFEDCDYAQRMGMLVGIAHQVAVECRMDHGGSKTIAAATPDEMAEHHRRFAVASQNYQAKWGHHA